MKTHTFSLSEHDIGIVISPILQMRKPRLKEERHLPVATQYRCGGVQLSGLAHQKHKRVLMAEHGPAWAVS